jgi:hypothetical protein
VVYQDSHGILVTGQIDAGSAILHNTGAEGALQVTGAAGFQGTLYGDAGVFNNVVADAGYFGGFTYGIHYGVNGSAPGPTCGNFTNINNPYDGGITCGGTDLSGYISVATVNSSGHQAAQGPIVWMAPGTAFSTGTYCTFSACSPAAVVADSEYIWSYVDAGILQVWSLADAPPINGPYCWTWTCNGN